MREDLDSESGPAPEPATPQAPQAGALQGEAIEPAGLEATLPEPRENEGEEDEIESGSGLLEDWKGRLRGEFERWLESIEEIPPGMEDTDPAGDAPDLYAFYGQLAAAGAEARKANRRTAETFSQWGETLTRFDGELRLLRDQLSRLPRAKEGILPRPWCLALVEVLDRAQRLAVAFEHPPASSWWSGASRWPKAWETQRRGFDILSSHLEELLKKAGVLRLGVLGQPFDPNLMAAVAVEPRAETPAQTVIEEVAPGYSLDGELLRVAQVKVSTRPS